MRENSPAEPAVSFEDINMPPPLREAITRGKSGKTASDHDAAVFFPR